MTGDDIARLSFSERLTLAQDGTTPANLLCLLDDITWAEVTADVAMRMRRRQRVDKERRKLDLKEIGALDERWGTLTAALVANPNTPLERLAQLVSNCPRELLQNPALPLLCVESPEFVLKMKPIALKRFLGLPDLPVPLVGVICGAYPDAEIQEEARSHVAMGGEVTGCPIEAVRAYLRSHLVRIMATASRGEDNASAERRELEFLAEHSLLPEWGEEIVKPAALASSAMTFEELKRSIGRPDGFAGVWVILHPICPLEYLQKIWLLPWGRALSNWRPRPDDWWLRLGTALSPKVGELEGILAILADDGNRYVRAIARTRLRGENPTL